MKQDVTIKSYPNGLLLRLDPDASFESILLETGEKFRESQDFFQDAKMVLAYEGRKLDEEQERQLMEAVCKNSRLRILSLAGRDEQTGQFFQKTIERAALFEREGQCGIYRGSLPSGRTITVKGSLLVMGDVEPGALVSAGRDIVVAGGLYGVAHAGTSGQERSLIAAFDLEPEALSIASLEYRPARKRKRFGKKGRAQPTLAFVDDESRQILLEPLTSQLLNDRAKKDIYVKTLQDQGL